MNEHAFASFPRCLAVALILVAAGGCTALRTATTPPPAFYSLDGARIASPATARMQGVVPTAALTLIVNPPHAAAGFDSQRIIYARQDHKVEYFAHSEWVDTPARMLAPLIVAALERGAAFRAVVLTPSAAAGDLRLDTEITRLQHDFGSQPTGVRFTLRAYLVDNTTRRVLAWREFDQTVAAESDDPYGGVVAANRVVAAVLQQLPDFCVQAAAAFTPARSVPSAAPAP